MRGHFPINTKRARAFAAVTCVALFASDCGSDGGPSGPGGGDLTLETSRAASDTVGFAGGVLVATSNEGVTYTLSIPAGALSAPTSITLTPIGDQKNLPVSGAFAGGADFKPAGLHFAVPVRLTASPLPAAPAGMQLIALSFEANGDSLGLASLEQGANSVASVLTHFSGTSFAFGTTADLASLARLTSTGSANQSFLNQLAALGVPTAPGNPAALPIITSWFNTVVLPELHGAGTDAELLLAIGDYGIWHEAAGYYLTGATPLPPLFPAPDLPVAGLSLEEGQAAHAIAPPLRNAIAGNNSACITQHNLQSLFNVLYWQQMAAFFGVATSAEQLDTATVFASLCASVASTSDSLSDPLQAGFPHTLVVGFGMEIGSVPVASPSTFSVTVTANGATVQNPTGFTNAAGFWGGSVVTTQGNGPVSITATACLLYPGTTQSVGVCGTRTIIRGSQDLTGLWTGIVEIADFQRSERMPLELHLTQNQNAIRGSYLVAVPNGPSGNVSGTLVGDTIFNFTLSERAPCSNRFVAGRLLIANGELQAISLLGLGCSGAQVQGSLIAGRTNGPPVHGVYSGTAQCANDPACPVQGGYTFSTLILQMADTIFFEPAGDFVDTRTGIFDLRAVMRGGAFSGNVGSAACLELTHRSSCAPDSSQNIPVTGEISGTTLQGSYRETDSGFSESFDLRKP